MYFNVIAPITEDQLLTEADRALIADIGTTVMWTKEYALHLWHGFTTWEREALYETVVEDFTDSFILYNNTPSDNRRQIAFSQRVHEYIDLLERIRQKYAEATAGEIDAKHRERPIDAVFLNGELPQAGVTIFQCRYVDQLGPDLAAFWSSK